MYGFTGSGIAPGLQAARETFENEFGWWRKEDLVLQAAMIDGAARDAGNSPTTVLRAGLLLGKVTSSGKLKEYDPDGVDGTEVVWGVLAQPFRVTDLDGSNQDLFVAVCVGGPIKSGKLYLFDSQSRGQMGEHFQFDDSPAQANKFPYLRTIPKATDYTVLTTDRDTLFTTRAAAGAVNFTLPAIAAARKGERYAFFNEANQNMTITSADGNDIVTFNDLAASSVAASTTNEKVGAHFEVVANDNGTKWLFRNLSPDNTLTIT